jgi:hypothetical protein
MIIALSEGSALGQGHFFGYSAKIGKLRQISNSLQRNWQVKIRQQY